MSISSILLGLLLLAVRKPILDFELIKTPNTFRNNQFLVMRERRMKNVLFIEETTIDFTATFQVLELTDKCVK